MEGMDLAISSVDPADMGKYACTVANGVGDSVVKKFRMEVTCKWFGIGSSRRGDEEGWHATEVLDCLCGVHNKVRLVVLE